MDNLGALTAFAFLALILKLIAILAIPAMLLIAARTLWSIAPRWIPLVIGIIAMYQLAQGTSMLLTHPLVRDFLGMDIVGRRHTLAYVFAIIGWPLAIASPMVVLALARRMKRMADQQA